MGMENVYAALAFAAVVLHLAYILFVILGALLVRVRPGLAWLHLPAVAWGVYVEWTGGICPLTPVENHFRRLAGLDAYTNDFVARYMLPVLYPDGLTREIQLSLAAILFAINAILYAHIVWIRRCRTAR